MKNIMLQGIIAICCMLFTGHSFGQKAQNAASNTNLPTCDEAVASAKKTNQTQANAECRTVHQCVPCKDAKTKKETCKAVTVQPQTGNCGAVASVVKTEVSGTAGKNKKAAPFKVEIFQNPCGNGGVTLEAVVVEDGQASFEEKTAKAYTYDWVMDGRASGTNSSVSCAQAKEAKVKVTKTSSGATITLYIKPPSANLNPSPSAMPLPVVPTLAAVYKKTGCFGLCPIYEVQFFADGRVRWNGKMNTGSPGIIETTTGQETLADIQRIADRVGFFDMKPRYPDYQVWDAPSTVIYLNMNGREKQVEDILQAPPALKELERYFDDFIKKKGWRTSPDKPAKSAQSATEGKQ